MSKTIIIQIDEKKIKKFINEIEKFQNENCKKSCIKINNMELTEFKKKI